jgi:hypothetical protein
MRAGVNEQPVAVLEGQRQLHKEFALGGIEHRTRPLNRVRRNRAHAGCPAANRSVMVALYSYRAGFL